ncbi:MAG: lytic transglycosylase domain-containing protein [Leptospiraceae bacterium]|nr:lytic transglycosylase domain-containing protein [Leptospiraceae bacterium]MCP5511222.1 lytic transglycosylase domain-containing protein [Leptospiraceae bacterium]
MINKIGLFVLILFVYSCGNTVSSKISYPVIPSSVSFAGEKVPLEEQDTKERLERELLVNQNYHTSTMLIYRHIGRYRDFIISILKENEVPEDFFYLAIAESSLNPNAVSSVGAMGIWQFMKGTAEGYGLEINNYVDERRNLAKATRAACRYLKEAHKEFGSWTMAAASYNRGVRGLKSAVEAQKESNYYRLYLNQETYRYIFRIIALKIILSNPGDYNFDISEKDFYPQYKLKIVTVKETISDLPEFAKIHKTTYKDLVLHNPWLKTGKYNFDPSGKSYDFLIPE